MTIPFSVSSEIMRRIEWWALLNCFLRPSDLPQGANEAAMFSTLTRDLPKHLRMEFWNGAFRGGRNKHLYV